MRCPFCDHLDDSVVDSRLSADGESIRRRRECDECGRRFTTYERIEEAFLRIVKSGGSREEYDRSKLRAGIELAAAKRPIPVETIDEVVDTVEHRLLESGDSEISSDRIGSMVSEQLRDIDPVAYLRFASVYRAFSEIQEFLAEAREIDESEGSSDD